MKRKGIAYIEVLIASAILTAVLIPSYGYFASLVQSQTTGENYIKVRNIIESRIEQERSKIAGELTEGQTTIAIDQLPGGQITTNLVNVDPQNPTLYRFEVQVNWQEPGGQRNISAATLINPE